MKRILYMVLFMAMNTPQLWAQSEFEGRKFEQMGTMLPTPNSYRTASGSPGPEYWQQKADYQIEATLDEEALTISGEETITYHNNSPETLGIYGCSWNKTCGAMTLTLTLQRLPVLMKT